MTAFETSSAWDLMVSLANNDKNSSVSTCSSSLDQLMGGGFPLGYVTEIAGGASCGKTQLCFQACTNVQLPFKCGGLEGEAVYLDSECTFVPSRIVDMANSLCQHFGFAEQKDIIFSPDSVLSRILHHRILNPSQLLSVIKSLDHVLKNNSRIKLVVVDSVAAPLRHEFDDYTYRSEYLSHVGALLSRLAAQYRVAVVVTNQMTAKLSDKVDGDDTKSNEIPSMGKAWASVPAMQIVIGRSSVDQKGARWAHLVKLVNPRLCPDDSCSFQITKEGIRDN